MSIQSHYVWQLLFRCGACVLWNGGVNGGNPTFVELHGAPSHPLVILTTLIWGATQGAKVALVACFALAGLAQWWLARVMGLSLTARLWAAALAVAGGQLAGRMENGVFGVVLSTASCSLVLAPALDLAINGRRRSTIALAITLALAILSGQGYLQIGLALSVVPALLALLVEHRFKVRPIWREYVVAGGLALLLAGVFLVPLAHFWPHILKDVDPSFQSVQPLEYNPLNLVVRDTGFFLTDKILGKLPYPYLYVNYIGWLPVLLALVALRLVPRKHLRILIFFLLALALVYCVSCALTLRLIQPLLPEFTAGVRNPSLISGLAVPLILALGAWGLDGILKLDWLSIRFAGPLKSIGRPPYKLRLGWLICAFPLVASVNDVYTFNQQWLQVSPLPVETYQTVHDLTTATTEWVAPPFGEHYWNPVALDAGLKITQMVRPWRWKDRSDPLPRVSALRSAPTLGHGTLYRRIDGLYVVTYSSQEYAEVVGAGRPVRCQATALGGDIDVTCATTTPGRLIVREHVLSGWTAQRDGSAVSLATEEQDWLSVAAPAGKHSYTFRYHPWDVPLGMLLTLLGATLSVWWALRRPQGHHDPQASEGRPRSGA